MKLSVAAVILVFLSVLSGCVFSTSPPVIYPIGLSFVPELGYIPEVDDWPAVLPGQFIPETQQVLHEWQKYSDWVEGQLSPETIQALSRWSAAQMLTYHTVPDLANLLLKPIAIQTSRQKLLLEGTADTLPSHSPLVTRWLKIYVIYDLGSRSILRVTVTIRGQVLE